VIDDASSDGTLIEVEGFVRDFPDFPLKIVKQSLRGGKAAALNKALDWCPMRLLLLQMLMLSGRSIFFLDLCLICVTPL